MLWHPHRIIKLVNHLINLLLSRLLLCGILSLCLLIMLLHPRRHLSTIHEVLRRHHRKIIHEVSGLKCLPIPTPGKIRRHDTRLQLRHQQIFVHHLPGVDLIENIPDNFLKPEKCAILRKKGTGPLDKNIENLGCRLLGQRIYFVLITFEKSQFGYRNDPVVRELCEV
jgi:hypothetical protein